MNFERFSGLLVKLAPEQTIAIRVLFIVGKFLASFVLTPTFLLQAESFPAECRLLGKV